MIQRVRLILGFILLLSSGFGNAFATPYLLVPSTDGSTADNGRVNRYDAVTGNFIDVFITASSEDQINGLTQGPDGNFYVSSFDTGLNTNGRILRFNGNTGNLTDTFIQPGSGGLFVPIEMVFGPDSNLYVVNGGIGGSILRYNGLTGEFIDTFATGFSLPIDLAFGPDGNLYVSDALADTIRRFNGATGAFIDNFVASGSGGLFRPEGIAFGSDDNLYVTAPFNNSVFRFNGTTGAFIDEFVSPGTGGLDFPIDLTFGPDGNLYVNTRTTVAIPGGIAGSVLRFNGATGAFIDNFVATGSGGLGLPAHGLMFADVFPISPTVVTIDIKPGSFPNSINPQNRGKTPVAILTTDTFDANTVNETTVRFGLTGTEAAPVKFALEDVDGDGDTDMILHFKTQDTGIVCGNTSASLTGETFGGQAITGSDSIKTAGCKKHT